MGRMKGLAAILGVAVLMAVVAACENGAGPTSLSDEVPTPAPPTEIPLTQVIELARSGDLQSIEVSGDKLEVTTLRGETFASRKVEGISIVELLDQEGVDHIGSGLRITVKGSAAQEIGSTSAGQTTVTPTPTATSTSEITPTQSSATEPDSIPLPPVIRLHYGGQVYDGVPGNFCWPTKPGVSTCGVETAFPWRDLDLPAIPVTAGDSIIVEIEADDRPQKLRAAIFAEASEHASDTAAQVIELDPGLKAPLAVDLTAGVYNMRITGQWGVGDQAYKFRLKVE